MKTRVEKREEQEKNKKKIKVSLKIFFIIFSVFLFLYLIFVVLGNAFLEVDEHFNRYDRLEEAFEGLKIVHFGDLHYYNSSHDQLWKVVNKINEYNADLVFFTGDLIEDYNEKNDAKIIEALKQIKAVYGKYAVLGNHDDGDTANILLKNSGFRVLNNEKDLIYNRHGNSINIVGVGDDILGNADYNLAFEGVDREKFTIFLTHEPDLIDEVIDQYRVDMAFAGHSHNGQVNIPFIGPLFLPRGARKYYRPYYEINDTILYITRGVGNSLLPVRMFNQPSISVIRVGVKR